MKRVIIVVCIVGILLGTFMTFSAGARPTLDDVRAKHESQLIATKGVSGVASDKATNEIVVFTETQKDCDKVPKELDGFKVRCEAIGRIEALQPAAVATQKGQQKVFYSRTGTDRPVFGGISVGSAADPGSAGTIGLVTSNGQVLSCTHVLAMYRSANFAPLGTAVWQPGGYDTKPVGTPNPIGTLTKFTSIDFTGAPNYADAAYATLTTSNLGKSNAVLNAANTGFVTINSVGVANRNDIVSKSGRTTGVTTSKVTYTGATVTVDYGNQKYAVFKDQILISNNHGKFSAAGDSGSMIYNTNDQFVGLLFAGSTGPNAVTVANTADNVMTYLGITI